MQICRSFVATAICRSPLALPLGELSAKLTERVFIIYPPRPSLRSDTSPKGGGKGVCHFAGRACKICGCGLPGGQRRPPLQDVVRGRRWCVQFCDCVLRGRGRTPPLRKIIHHSPFIIHYSLNGKTGGASLSPTLRRNNTSSLFTITYYLPPKKAACPFGQAAIFGGVGGIYCFAA